MKRALALVVAAIALGSVVPRESVARPAVDGSQPRPGEPGRSDTQTGYPPPVTSRIAAIIAAAPTSTGSVGSALLGGWATFYEDPAQRIDHYAAAGKLLRDALGDWRGKVIRVQSGQHSTIVALRDFCACGERHGLPTLLDLSPQAFRDLAPLSAGIVRVTVELVTLPSTDALPRNAADLRMQAEVRGDELYGGAP